MFLMQTILFVFADSTAKKNTKAIFRSYQKLIQYNKSHNLIFHGIIFLKKEKKLEIFLKSCFVWFCILYKKKKKKTTIRILVSFARKTVSDPFCGVDEQ